MAADIKPDAKKAIKVPEYDPPITEECLSSKRRWGRPSNPDFPIEMDENMEMPPLTDDSDNDDPHGLGWLLTAGFPTIGKARAVGERGVRCRRWLSLGSTPEDSVGLLLDFGKVGAACANRLVVIAVLLLIDAERRGVELEAFVVVRQVVFECQPLVPLAVPKPGTELSLPCAVHGFSQSLLIRHAADV